MEVQEQDLAKQIQSVRGQFDDELLLNHLATNGYLDPENIKQAKDQGLTSKDILDHLSSGSNPVILPSKPNTNPVTLNPSKPPTSTVLPKKEEDYSLKDFGMGIAAPAAGAAAVGLSGGSGLAISAVMPLIENLLKARYSDRPEDADLTTPKGFAIKTLVDATGNEVGGKALNVLQSGSEEVVKRILGLNSIEDQLGLTVGQRTGSKVAKFIEDIFSPKAKSASIQNSLKTGKGLIENQASQIAQRPVTLEDYASLIGAADKSLVSDYYASAKASTAKGNFVQGIAQSNPVPIYKTVKQPILGPLGQVLNTNTTKVLDKTIEGPIELASAISAAKAIKDQITTDPSKDALVKIISDPQYNTLQKTAARILDETNAAFDKKGNLISHDPVSFKNAWQWQQDLGNYTADSFETGTINFNKSQMNQLHKNIGDDVTNSIPNWKTNGPQGLQLWNDSKALVRERMENFFPNKVADVLSAGQILNKDTNLKDRWTAIINDNVALSKALKSGELPQAAAAGVPIANPRKELAAFKFADMWNNAYDQDANGKISFNVDKFLNQFRDINFAQSENKLVKSSKDQLYSSGTQQDIERFVQAFAKTQQQGQIGPSRYLALRAGSVTIGLSAGLAGAMLTGQDPNTTRLLMGAGLLGGSIGLHELGRLLTNKEYARVLVSMAEGSGIGMSDRLAARVLVQGLRNSPIKFQLQDGSELSGKINSQGNFQVLGQPIGDEVKVK